LADVIAELVGQALADEGDEQDQLGGVLFGANLERADLDRAVANRNTTWQEEFNPAVAGVTFE
jgi:hypothetical protein